jgi:hypothetical protein
MMKAPVLIEAFISELLEGRHFSSCKEGVDGQVAGILTSIFAVVHHA